MFRHIIFTTMAAVAGIAVGTAAEAARPTKAVGVTDIVSALQKVECYRSTAQFNVSMPQMNDDVVYRIELYETAASGDTLLPCTYLIDWQLTSREDPVSGFSAYYDGNHYRFAGERIQEYHMKRDAMPFAHGFDATQPPSGVQRTAQFANLLPTTIAEELQRMLASDSYSIAMHPDTVVSGMRCICLEAVMKVRGVTAIEASYMFDRTTLMPLGISLDNNPGAISEQSVEVRYTDTTTDAAGCSPVTEEMLIGRYPDTFENFRESSFRIENMPGKNLPGFALPTTTGERYMRRTADGFAAPTIVAILDASHGFTPDIVAALRTATDAMPYNAELIMAFADKNVDAIESIVPSIRPGEHLLMGASPLARECGAAALPVILLTDATGKVTNVILGYNNDLASDVIQKMALIPSTGASPTRADNNTTINNNNSIATSMETVHFKGEPCHTYGSIPAVGSQAPEFNLTGADLSAVKSEDFKGKTVVLNIFPSLDTEVCARSVRRFNEEASKLANTKVICVSEDLPFAMGRFCTLEGLKDVIPASAFRSPKFGEKYGLMLVDGPLAGLLTRAVIVIDPDGTVAYRDLVDEITNEPDYDAALRVIKGKFR